MSSEGSRGMYYVSHPSGAVLMMSCVCEVCWQVAPGRGTSQRSAKTSQLNFVLIARRKEFFSCSVYESGRLAPHRSLAKRKGA